MIRIGIDFGGTKIEAAALDAQGQILARLRRPTPSDYDAALKAVAGLVDELEALTGAGAASLGIGGPGSISPASGLMRGANSTFLNQRPFPQDLERALKRPVRFANDANCMALSEAVDGAGAGAPVVFAAILGTGCGGGLVVDGRLIEGRNGFAGEWGHASLPWPTDDEHPGPTCWCGRRGCLEVWLSGTGFGRDHGGGLAGIEVAAAARAGEPSAVAALDRYVDRLARSLAAVCNVVDPDVIVLAGGMSNVTALYDRLPRAIADHVFSDVFTTPVRQALHGDSSGVRGAAWLWPPP